METIVEDAFEVGLASFVDRPAASFGKKDGLAIREGPTKRADLNVASLPEEVARSVDAFTPKP